MTRFPLVLAMLLVLGLAVGSCTESVTTEVVRVTAPLPETEQTRYRLLDNDGATIGSAVFSIAPDADGLRLGLAYEFGADKTDTGSVVVRRESMRPVRAERTVVEGERRYVTRAAYNGDVTVTLDDGRRMRDLKAGISDSSYDNLEALFLWRTIDMSTGTEVRYVNVVVDPRRGNINRALGTVEVVGRENVRVGDASVPAWRVEFRSAGITNTAWYRIDESRQLLRYDITRGPTLVLEQ